MKIILCVIMCIVVSVAAKPAEQYTDKYDGISIKEVLANRRLLLPYVKCMLDQGKCSSEGKLLKAHIQEALENFCAKCTEAQHSGSREVIKHLINNEPDLWKQLTDKYDPERKYIKQYEEELKSIKA